MLVDDIELNRTLTEAVLRGATYEVDSVGDGASALAALEDKRYDLVLMDLEMPGLDGHAAASAIRQRERVAPKLAALSARSSAAVRSRSAAVGMAAHIARPIAPHALLREIERVFLQPAVEPAGAAASDEVRDPWQRQHYEEWVARLGAERMHAFLAKLHEQFRELLATLLADDAGGELLHRRAHDVASTGGMLGFLDVTARCRDVLEGKDDIAGPTALAEALELAILRLDRHFARGVPGAVAA